MPRSIRGFARARGERVLARSTFAHKTRAKPRRMCAFQRTPRLETTRSGEAIKLSPRLPRILRLFPPRFQPAVVAESRQEWVEGARRQIRHLHQIVAVTPAPRRFQEGGEGAGRGSCEPLHELILHMTTCARKALQCTHALRRRGRGVWQCRTTQIMWTSHGNPGPRRFHC